MNNIKTPKERVLFICTHNSGQSQMAEGILKHLYGEKFEVYSAGTQVTSVNPLTIDVLAEVGIDILNYRSKSINEFKKMKFNYVITVCDSAKETCPFFPNGEKFIHKGFEDPSAFIGTSNEKLKKFRQVRDIITNWLTEYFYF